MGYGESGFLFWNCHFDPRVGPAGRDSRRGLHHPPILRTTQYATRNTQHTIRNIRHPPLLRPSLHPRHVPLVAVSVGSAADALPRGFPLHVRESDRVASLIWRRGLSRLRTAAPLPAHPACRHIDRTRLADVFYRTRNRYLENDHHNPRSLV